MISPRNLAFLFGALVCGSFNQLLLADEGCPDLERKDAAAHLEYLRGDRGTLSSKCVLASIRYIASKRYMQASATLIQYLEYPDTVATARRGIILEIYPAIDALCALHKSVVPELTAAIAGADTAQLARENAALTILLIYSASQPEAITALVSAAHSQTDPTAATRLMDKARWLTARCIGTNRNECENAVLK
jgi:hypothetical protein